MNIASNTAFQILQMLIILIIGVYASKKELIDSTGQKKLTTLLFEIVSPLIIFTSYQKDFSTKLLVNLGIVVLVSLIAIIIGIIASIVLISNKGERDYKVERMAIMYSNCGFIGIPIMQALFQSEGVFYCTGFITAFNFVCWSYGILMHSEKKVNLFNILKGRNMIAIILGIIFFVLRIKLPLFVFTPMSMIGNMNTPLAFLIIGSSIGHLKLKEIFFDLRSYLIIFYHNILVPILVAIFLVKLPIDEVLKQIILIATACPVGATTTTFSVMFGRDYKYASKLIANSTILSLATIPIVLFVYALIS